MTKADKIRDLYRCGWTVNEIAAEVGCGDSYVRVAARQRVGGSNSKNDRVYYQRHRQERLDYKRRYYRENRAAVLAKQAAYYHRRKASQEARA